MANISKNLAPNRTIFVVAAALIDAEARVLVQRRPVGKAEAGLWEFPGGKVEPGEQPAAALVRELREELGIDVEAGDLRPLSFTTADLAGRQLVLLLYACHRWTGDPQPLHADRVGWNDAQGMNDLDLVAADRDLLDAIAAAVASRP